MSRDNRTELLAGQKISLCNHCVKSMCEAFKTGTIGVRYCYGLDSNQNRGNIAHTGAEKKRYPLINTAWKYGKFVKVSNDDRRAFLEKVAKGELGSAADTDTDK